MRPEVDQGLLEQRLGEFRCERDKQLELFIGTQALKYEKRGFSRTYFVFDTASEAQNTIPPIAAFFTLSLAATDFSNINNSKKRKVLGSKPGRNTFKAFPGVLIGQLARDDRYTSSFINGAELLKECERYIELGREYLGGYIVYLDCKAALIRTYQQSGYQLLADPSNEEGYYKMCKVLPANGVDGWLID
jgi:hypothetical protein